MRRDAGLSDAAKVLAAALCDDFAHHETGFCNPSLETLAEAVGKSVRTVQRALAELRAAGWIEVSEAHGRGRCNEFGFLKGANPDAFSTSEKVTRLTRQAPEKVTNLTRGKTENTSNLTRKGDNPDMPPTPPYKDKPTNNQKAGAKAAVLSDPRQPHQRAVVHQGYQLEAWNDWLSCNGFECRLQDISEKLSDQGGLGFDWVSRMPPATDNLIESNCAKRFVNFRLYAVGLR
ncbi:helix-turn-helix domain-containing protein [Rhodobacter sp. JA431]|uniref:helix-turn-helix domain-containing protein n=1 Tax=Rhodobacter sp. JA431 TaxID=570013 RepID=UPI001BB07750|nr:helix-turn-helix domain-containing protein [Rhodobacter sp. JA431]